MKETRLHLHYLDATRDPTLLPLSPALAEWAGEEAARTGEDFFVLRRQSPYFLLGPGDRRLPDVPSALAWAAARGIPLYRRIGGGSLVFLDGGCLSFASAVRCRDVGHITHHFTALTRPIFLAFERLGLSPSFGAARGSYCEGPWDILTDGRKIAGVSQAMRRGYALVSGMLLVEQDPVVTTSLVNDFYEAGGGGRPFDPAVVTSISRLTDGRVGLSTLRDTVEDALGTTSPVSVEGEGRRRISELLRARRVHPRAD